MEKKLYKNADGRYALSDYEYFTSGSAIELKLCGQWVRTVIEHDGNDYYAVGLNGLVLEGLVARKPEN